MTTDYRAELQLLFDAAESFTEPALGHHRPWAAALDRAHALLAQPVAEEPTDEELLRVLGCATASFPPNHPKAEPMTGKEYALTLELRKARAVLARWGNSQAILDSSPHPVAVSERLPGPDDCDAEGRCWWEFEVSEDYEPWPCWTLREMYGIPFDTTHWLPANALPIPETTND